MFELQIFVNKTLPQLLNISFLKNLLSTATQISALMELSLCTTINPMESSREGSMCGDMNWCQASSSKLLLEQCLLNIAQKCSIQKNDWGPMLYWDSSMTEKEKNRGLKIIIFIAKITLWQELLLISGLTVQSKTKIRENKRMCDGASLNARLGKDLVRLRSFSFTTECIRTKFCLLKLLKTVWRIIRFGFNMYSDSQATITFLGNILLISWSLPVADLWM